MKTVKAKIKTTTITASVATVENGEIFTEDLTPIVTSRKVTESNAAKIFMQETKETIEPGAALLIRGFEVTETVYEMPLADFLHYYEIWSNPE